MLVKEVMNRSVRSVGPDARVMEVASIMCLYRIPGIPVVEEGERLVGIIAEKDVLHSVFPKLETLMSEGMGNVDLDSQMATYKDVMDHTVADLMTKNPITASPGMHVLRAATIMVRNRFRRIPVVEDGVLVGMLSLGDVHKAIFHQTVAGQLGKG